eukprot:505942-Pyramimonas_sp.AAC.1
MCIRDSFNSTYGTPTGHHRPPRDTTEHHRTPTGHQQHTRAGHRGRTPLSHRRPTGGGGRTCCSAAP